MANQYVVTLRYKCYDFLDFFQFHFKLNKNNLFYDRFHLLHALVRRRHLEMATSCSRV